jgi:hypothetical protein
MGLVLVALAVRLSVLVLDEDAVDGPRSSGTSISGIDYRDCEKQTLSQSSGYGRSHPPPERSCEELSDGRLLERHTLSPLLLVEIVLFAVVVTVIVIVIDVDSLSSRT